MPLKFIPYIACLILIAIFVVLFNLSLPNIKQKYVLESALEIINENTNNFINSLSESEKNLLLSLPCQMEASKCPDVSALKTKLKDAFNSEELISKLILTADGKEIFSNRNIDKKYDALVKDAANEGISYLNEQVNSKKINESRLIALKKISKINKQKDFDNKIILVALDANKIGIFGKSAIILLATIIPLILVCAFIVYLGIKFQKSKQEVERKTGGYISQIEELRRENVQQSQFLANFTHELRTPLNSIIGFSGLLKDQTLGELGNPEYAKYASDINVSGLHLLSLINDILDYSKSEVGKLKVNISEVDVVKIIKQSLSLVAPRASESKLDLLQSFASDFFVVRLDPKRFKQIMLNLLSNSVKFTPEGGSVMVSVFPDIKGEKISIEVKDTGVGIAEKDIPTVMSLFGQVETNLNRKYEGTGIGLPFAKKLTTLMGGSFDMQSKVGVGTRITLTFDYDKILNSQYSEMMTKK